MGAQINAQTLGLQLEKVRDKVPLLYQQDHTLFDKIMKREVEKVSSRNMKVPLQLLAGGKARQVNPDGGGLGRGSGTTYDIAQVTPVYLAFASEITYLTEIATDAKEKAVENAAKKELENAMTGFRVFIEALLNTDGSGTLGTVTAITGSVVTVTNANNFYDNQDIQAFSTLGGTRRVGPNIAPSTTGTYTILSVDAVNFQLTMTTAPTNMVVGDLLIIDGAPGTAASSLFGLEYHNVDPGATGTWMQLARSAYPGKLQTPHVAAGNSSISVAWFRLALQKMRRKLGIKAKDVDQIVWHMGLDQEAAWETVATQVSSIFFNEVKGDAAQDFMKKHAPMTAAQREIVPSIHAVNGRIDGLAINHWFRAENKALDYYEVGGQTVFPTYDTVGGIAMSNIFYLFTGMQVCVDGPTFGCYIDGLTVPTGL
jgi:hypothetical protein